MPTKPKHYAMFILNGDGSGTVKQFDTWQEAKAAYAALDATDKAVYLYPQPMKSIGAGTTPIEAPAKTPVVFTAAQNTGEFAWPPHPPLPRPTAPKEDESGSDVFGDKGPYYKWQDYCTAHPTHRECTIPGKEKFGTQVGAVCSILEGNLAADSKGNLFQSYFPQQLLANGLGGTFQGPQVPDSNQFDSPCKYPEGFKKFGDLDIFDVREIVVFTLKSAATAGPAFIGNALCQIERDVLTADAQGVFSVTNTERGLRVPEDFKADLVPAENGDPITTINGTIIGTINVVYPLMPLAESMTTEVGTVDEDTYVTIAEHGNQVKTGHRFATKYENRWPDMDPDSVVSNIGYDPEFGTGTGAWSITHGPIADGGVNFEWIPGTPADKRPPAGWAGYVGRGADGSFDKVNPPVPAPEGQTWQGEWEYDYYPNGTILDEDTENYYKSDGAGSYYAESKVAPPCTPADTLVNEGASEPIYFNAGCGDWEIGTLYYDVYADGNCSYYSVTTSDSYTSSGQLLGKCGDYCYFTSGNNEPTMEQSVAENQQIGEATTTPLTYNAGCGDWEIGTRSVATLSNGDCTTREETSDTYNPGDIGTCNGTIYSVDSAGTISSRPDCPSSGTDLGQDPSDGCYNLYADGNCGTYSGWNGSCSNCDSSGMFISQDGPYDLMYDAGCGSIQIGYYYIVSYTDGNCGSYTNQESTTSPGDFTTCNGYIYSVDASGNVTSRPDNACPGSGQFEYSDECNNYYTDGNCGYYSEPNGNCGGGCPSNGEYAYSDGCIDYYHNGDCGYYSVDNCGNGCDGSGNYVGMGSDNLYYNAGCGDWQVGYVNWTEYTDGSCGTYRSYDNPSYNGSGNYLGECNGWNYYTDGNGGAYSS